VKVICPDLCQLHGNHNLKFFGGKRLFELPYKLGLTDKIKSIDELFPYPHPFP
jgi:ribosomal protein S12 methylthiotransferase accessory factor